MYTEHSVRSYWDKSDICLPCLFIRCQLKCKIFTKQKANTPEKTTANMTKRGNCGTQFPASCSGVSA